MSTILLAVLAVGASPAAVTSDDAVSPDYYAASSARPDAQNGSPLRLRQSWRDRVTVALRDQVGAEASNRGSAFWRVVELLTELKAEAGLSRIEQQRLAAKLQRRIVRVGPEHQALFQQAGAFGGGVLGVAGAGNDASNGLVDLIQTTIDPESWDINGGPGSIAIFSQ